MGKGVVMSKKELIKSLGLLDVFCIATGAMISSGIFILPGVAFEKVGPAMILAGFVMDHPEFMLLPQRYTQEGYGVAFRKDAASASLKFEVNNAIAELRKKGHLNQLKAKWLPLASDNLKK